MQWSRFNLFTMKHNLQYYTVTISTQFSSNICSIIMYVLGYTQVQLYQLCENVILLNY